VNVVLVGGGAIMIDPALKLQGVKEIIVPHHFECANAIGAAIAHNMTSTHQILRSVNSDQKSGKPDEVPQSTLIHADEPTMDSFCQGGAEFVDAESFVEEVHHFTQ